MVCVYWSLYTHGYSGGVCVRGFGKREQGTWCVFTGRCIYTDTVDVCVFKVSRNDDFIPLVSLVLLIHFTHV
jgi:hypothetical protein